MRVERVITVCDLPHDHEVIGDKARFVIAERICVVDACADHRAELSAAVRLVERARAAYLANTPKQAGTPRAKRTRSRF